MDDLIRKVFLHPSAHKLKHSYVCQSPQRSLQFFFASGSSFALGAFDHFLLAVFGIQQLPDYERAPS
jgi:hypothetical protein